jgi:hypothetical protein
VITLFVSALELRPQFGHHRVLDETEEYSIWID